MGSVNLDSDKILIIAGDGTCFNALNDFADSFAEGLKKRGYKYDIRYINTLDEKLLANIIKEDYKAIIGFQTNLFTLEISRGVYVGNIIKSHKYNYIFDPPATKREYFEPHINGLTFFYHDKGYLEYLRGFFPHVRAVYSPPGGGASGTGENISLFDRIREYDLSFVGTYGNYREILDAAIKRMPDWGDVIVSFFEYLINNPDLSAETAIQKFNNNCGLGFSHDELPALFELLYASEDAAKSFYREMVIEALIENDIAVDVFSYTWKRAPYSNDKRLRIHDQVSYRESMNIIENSKMSLNVFSWHKNSITERISNIMLGGAVCVSDYSSELDKLFDNGKDLVLFNLDNLDELSSKVKELLDQKEKLTEMAMNGHSKAYKDHRWINRVDDFIRLIKDEKI